MFFLFYFGNCILSASCDEEFNIESPSLSENPNLSTNQQAQKEGKPDTAKTEESLPKIQLLLNACEQTNPSPNVANHESLDQNYLLRSVLDCFSNSCYFKCDLFKGFYTHEAEHPSSRFNLVLMAFTDAKINWLSEHYNTFEKIGFFATPPDKEPAEWFIFCLFRLFELQGANSNSDFSFLPVNESMTTFCFICRTFSVSAQKILAFIRLERKPEKSVESILNDYTKPINTKGFKMRQNQDCNCPFRVRNDPKFSKKLTNIRKFPNLLAMKNHYVEDIDPSSCEELPLTLEGDNYGKYKLKGFILSEGGEYFSVTLDNEKWILSCTKGMFDVTEIIQKLIRKNVVYVFYDELN